MLPIQGGRITCGFGCKGSLWQGGRHRGVDFHAAAGTPVLAPWSGVVTGVGTWGRAYGSRSPVIDFDRLSAVRPGLWGVLAHLEHCYVVPGERVAAGQMIGRVGMRGNATGPHLHFEVHALPYWTPWNLHKERDPMPWLWAVPAGAKPQGGGNGP